VLCWQLRGVRGQMLTCGLYKAPRGCLEVRCGYSTDDLMRSQVVRNRDAGETVAAVWKLSARGLGTFRELASGETSRLDRFHEPACHEGEASSSREEPHRQAEPPRRLERSD
jgi:hypothetical protein